MTQAPTLHTTQINKLISKLDLDEYINSLKALLCREHNLFLHLDYNWCVNIIKELRFKDELALKPLNRNKNLDDAIEHLKAQGVLHIEDIYYFCDIAKYFLYAKRLNLKEYKYLFLWFESIDIPQHIQDFAHIFDKHQNIKKGFNDELDIVNEQIDYESKNINNIFADIFKKQNLQFYLIDTKIHFFNNQECLLLRGGFENVLRAKVLSRSESGFFYVQPDVIAKVATKLQKLKFEKQRILSEICKEISDIFRDNLDSLELINKEFDKLDYTLSRVLFAINNGTKFILPSSMQSDKRILELNNFSHPALKSPNIVKTNITSNKNIILFTGVNAGGKTMALKSLLSACFFVRELIPFDVDTSSVIPYYKNIVAILDDPQSVSNDISTFAGRMVEFSEVFKAIKEQSCATIVGVDEIELGTDSDEAASLFRVMLEYLAKANTKIIATTHHKRLAQLLSDTNYCELFAALYDEQNSKPEYEFLKGTIGKSYAFETALKYGISDNIIQNAKKVYGDDKNKTNELIQANIDLNYQLKHTQKKMQHKLKRIKQSKQAMSNRIKDYSIKFNKILSDLKNEYFNAINEAKKSIAKNNIQDAHKSLNKAHALRTSISTKDADSLFIIKKAKLKIGDKIKFNNSNAVIVELNSKKQIAIIESDSGIKMQVLLKNIIKDRQDNTKNNKTLKVNLKKVMSNNNAKTKLDIRGCKYDEAEDKLEQFISDSLVAGFSEVAIIHGYGNGVLSKLVREFAKNNKNISSFKHGSSNQGGRGVSVFKL